MSNFDPSDTGVYRNFEEIISVLEQIENQTEELLSSYKSRKDTENFKPGKTGIDLPDVAQGDPRRPNLTPVIAHISVKSITPSQTEVDVEAFVNQLRGNDVTDADVTEINYEIIDNSDNVVADSSYSFEQSNTPLSNTSTLTGLSSATNYTVRLTISLNGDVKATDTKSFSTLT